MAATPFTFTPTDFKDGSTGGTPITAAELNKINTGISQLYEALPHYVVTASTDTPPSTPCILIVVKAGAYGGAYYADGSNVTQIHWPAKPPLARVDDTTIGLHAWGNGITATAAISYAGGAIIQPWANIQSAHPLPAAYRPPVTLIAPVLVGSSAIPQLAMIVGTNGYVSLSNQSNNAITLNKNNTVTGVISWSI